MVTDNRHEVFHICVVTIPMQLAIEILPINAEKYMRYVDMIEEEIALLKGWRKADNKKNRSLAKK